MAESTAYQVVLLKRIRRLPLPGEVLVKQGQWVEPGTVVARIDLRPGIPWVLPVSRQLGIEPGQLPAAMLRRTGDRIRLREIIATTQQGLYGRKDYASPVDGAIEDISSRSGRVVVREEFGREEPPVSLDAAFEIGCRPRDLPRNMVKQLGEEVKRGQVVAKKGETQAFFTRTALAPVSGVITAVDDRTGHVIISRPFKEVVVRAHISGLVTGILPGRGAIIETAAARIAGVFGLGRETHGRLRTAAEKDLGPQAISPDDEGAILVTGGRVSREAMQRGRECGVAGIIGATASYFDLAETLGVRVGVAITGQEDSGLTLVLTEGFGCLDMRESALAALRSLEGRLACISGATQIRAGAIRPEVVVPFPGVDGVPVPAVPDENLRPGQRVRVVCEPCFGRPGAVIELPPLPETLVTEALVPVVVVALDDGTNVRVPRANVEVL